MSEDVPKNLHDDLAEVMAEVGYVAKDAQNSFHKYKYASAEAVLKKVNAALSSRHICLQTHCTVAHFNEPSKAFLDGKIVDMPSNAVVHLRIIFVRGKEQVSCEGLGQGSDKGDKAVMKAFTAAQKYAYASAFAISWGDDPEADSSTDEQAERKPRKKAAPKVDLGNILDNILGKIKVADGHVLELLKEDIKAFGDGTQERKQLIAAYKTRKEALNA